MTITQQEIIALAVEAGFDDITPWLDVESVEQGQIDAANRLIERMAAFAALIGFVVFEKERQLQAIAVEEAYRRGVHDEREACAKVCDLEANEARMVRKVEGDLVGLFLGHRVSALDAAAAAIRARSAE